MKILVATLATFIALSPAMVLAAPGDPETVTNFTPTPQSISIPVNLPDIGSQNPDGSFPVGSGNTTIVTIGSPAGDTGFVALAPIANLSDDDYTDLPKYLNAVFNLVISVAAMLAVIMIVIHGVQYMLKESVPDTKNSLDGIRNAVMGLILLLVSWLILFVINPQILDLSALKSSLSGTTAPGGSSDSAPAGTSDYTPPPTTGLENTPGPLGGNRIIWETGP